MNSDVIITLTETFEAHAQKTESGVEYWHARDLQNLLGYGKWDSFINVIGKAKIACETAGFRVPDHFADAGRMVFSSLAVNRIGCLDQHLYGECSVRLDYWTNAKLGSTVERLLLQ